MDKTKSGARNLTLMFVYVILIGVMQTVNFVESGEIACPEVPSIENGMFSVNGLQVTYQCRVGWSLVGSPTIDCLLPIGEWSNPPECVFVCDLPSSIQNGNFSGTGLTVNYECIAGYGLVGNSTRECQDTGSWTGFAPECIFDCGPRAQVTNSLSAEISTHFLGSTLLGDRTEYYCLGPYTIVGNITTVCTGDGWTDAPYCAPELHTKCVIGLDTCYDQRSNCQFVGTCECMTGFTEFNGTCQEQSTKTTSTSTTTTTKPTTTMTMTLPTTTTTSPTATTTTTPVPTTTSVTTPRTTTSPYKVCPDDNDSRGTMWAETLRGVKVTKACHAEFSGNVTRQCGQDGTWLLPRYNCVRESVTQIENKIADLTNDSTTMQIDNVLQEMVVVTQNSTTATVQNTLTDTELTKIASSLATVAEVLNTDTVTDDLSDQFVATTSNLFDGSNKKAWLTLNEDNKKGAITVLSAMETMSQILTQQLGISSGNITVIAKTNVVIEIKKTFNEDIVFPTKSASGGTDQEWLKDSVSNIRIPAAALPDGSVLSAGTVFRNMSEVLPVNTNDSSDDDTNRQLNGPVMALTITPEVKTLNPKLQILFEHSLVGYTDPVCSFWRFQSNALGYWSDEGCAVVATNSTQTTCECDHLTNFAVLMSPFKEGAVEDTALRIVSIIGISISLLCLILTMTIHICLWRYLRNDRVTILMNLCTALIISYIVFLAGVDRTESSLFCTVIAVVLQYIYLVVFCLMLVEGIVVAITVLFVFVKNTKIKLLLTLAWAVPVVITGISLGITKTDGYGNENFCWLSVNNGLIWAFVGPALLIILINLVVLGVVIRAMFQTKAMSQKKKMDKMKTSIRSLCVLIPLMGVSWVLGILYINDNLYWMQYVFAVFNGLQGFFIFLFHSAFNIQVKNAFSSDKRRRSSTSWKTNRMSSIDESKSERIKRSSMDSSHSKRSSVDSGYSHEGISSNTRTSVDTQRPSINSNYSRRSTNKLGDSRIYDYIQQ